MLEYLATLVFIYFYLPLNRPKGIWGPGGEQAVPVIFGPVQMCPPGVLQTHKDRLKMTVFVL